MLINKMIFLFRKFRWIIVALLVLLLVLLSFTIFYFEYTGRLEAIATKHPSLAWFEDLPLALDIYYLPLMIKGSNLPEYRIEIDENKLSEINQSLPKQRGCFGWDIFEDNRQYQPATLKLGGQDYEVKLKVRGDCFDHWINEKKSWKIKFGNVPPADGFTSVDLMIASSQEYIMEELNYYRAKKLDLAVPPSRFVKVFINGNYYGLYWERKSHNKDVLEINNINSDINLYGDDIISNRLFKNVNYWQKYSFNPHTAEGNFAELQLLLDLINNASDEEFKKQIPMLVDLDNFYRWHILEMLGGNYHQDFAHNMRLYFDATLGKFKLMPADIGISTESANDYVYNPLVTRILENEEFAYERNKILWDYVGQDNNLADDLREFDKYYDLARWPVYRDRTKDHSNFYFDRKIRVRRQIMVDNFMSARDLFVNDNNNANIIIERQSDSIVGIGIEVDNFSGLKIKDINIDTEQPLKYQLIADSNHNGNYDLGDVKLADIENGQSDIKRLTEGLVLLSDRSVPEGISYVRPEEGGDPDIIFQPIKSIPTMHRLFLVADNIGNTINDRNLKLKLENVITGEEINENERFVDSSVFDNWQDIFLSPQEFVNRHPMFSFVNGSFILPAGQYFFERDIVVPGGYRLVISPGVSVALAKDVSLISYSPVVAVGSPEAPIRFFAARSDQPWGSFGVVGTKDKNIITYANFSGGFQDYINGVFFSGMVSIYHSPVEVSNCYFSDAHGDDSLNVKNAETSMRNNNFSNNGFDAIDCDFCTGQAEGNIFSDNGNDAFDVSGSKMIVSDNRIFNAGDKGISVGERSDLIIFNNLIKDGNYGIAAKDGSTALFFNNTVTGNNIALAAYQKKPIFGGGNLKVFNSIIWGNEQFIEQDEKSDIEIKYSIIDSDFGDSNSQTPPVFQDNFRLKNTNDFSDIMEFGWFDSEGLNLEIQKSIIGIY